MTLTHHDSEIEAGQSSQRAVTPGIVPGIVGVEMWERFSFYGMQAIMVYYLYATTTGIGLDKATATALMGAYGASVYLCTIAGGWVADRLFGAERTLLGGAVTLVIGHLALSLIPGGWGVAIGLILVAIGSGVLKTSAITLLGQAFPVEDDARRDSAFQLFYLGINVGALLGPLLTGWLATTRGYHVGFAAAAVLMVIGLVYYLAFRRKFIHPELLRPQNPISNSSPLILASVALLAVIGVATLVTTGTIGLDSLATILLVATLAVTAALFAQMLASKDVTGAEKRRVVAYLPLFFASCAFWSVLNQTYGVLAVYSDVRLDRTIGSFTIPASWTQSLNPFYILVLSLPLAWLWRRIPNLNSPTKMGLGVIISGSGLLVLLPFTGSGANSTPFLALAGATLIITLGELLVGPVGMSATTAYAPQAFATRFSALYFLTMAIGTATAGVLSKYYNSESASAETTYFLSCSLVVMTIGAIVFFISRKAHH
ncbi:peptide MFS transporter [Corynebacterium sp.]|uniref:peptide MFS transporter n=1 Tax=Corynebacterium sp. TaxID=1720 RepID=UPI0026DCF99F|nr:oligopeptide:H+ symporter [Corynebacterium sp.]MDO5077335.1 oligopeptide:H+ symporter [Corynebacterium sp.]